MTMFSALLDNSSLCASGKINQQASTYGCASIKKYYNNKVSEVIYVCSCTSILVLEVILVACERTLLMVKPDGVQRHLLGPVILRIEQKGLAIVDMCMFHMDSAFVHIFYAEHAAKDFFPALLEFMTSGPVVALQIESERSVAVVRTMIGATRPEDRLPGTIRGDFSNDLTANVVHASATQTDAQRELQLVFGNHQNPCNKKECRTL